jgi:hypothetical protein
VVAPEGAGRRDRRCRARRVPRLTGAHDDDPVLRLLPLDLLEPRHRAACSFGDPEGETGRIVLRDAVLLDVPVEVGEVEGGVVGHVSIVPGLAGLTSRFALVPVSAARRAASYSQ